MKAIVLRSFRDKKTGIDYKPGQEFKEASERIKEINDVLKGALEVVVKPDPVQLNLVSETEKVIKRRRSKKS
jgi:hypothetical protein